MKLTPLDIQHQQFRVRFRGFDIQEVDAFLEQMAEAFEAMQEESARLNDTILRLQREIRGFREREDSFKRAMLNSQKVIDQMKDNARKSAELVVADAELRAEKLVQHAHGRLVRLHEDIAELKRQRGQIEVQLQSIIDSHARLLELGREEMRAKDDQDAKLKLLQQSK
ncbi:MAG: DivIVA domain-containing protein [Desulfobacterales bacterium]|nr:DivIVA domain-containing protein [Desulfobacterales bacterium]